jgi:hypothetical protein
MKEVPKGSAIKHKPLQLSMFLSRLLVYDGKALDKVHY